MAVPSGPYPMVSLRGRRVSGRRLSPGRAGQAVEGRPMASLNVPAPLDGVAIVGMSARVPGARDLAQFWTNLCDGVESIAGLTDEELLAAGVAPALFREPA